MLVYPPISVLLLARHYPVDWIERGGLERQTPPATSYPMACSGWLKEKQVDIGTPWISRSPGAAQYIPSVSFRRLPGWLASPRWPSLNRSIGWDVGDVRLSRCLVCCFCCFSYERLLLLALQLQLGRTKDWGPDQCVLLLVERKQRARPRTAGTSVLSCPFRFPCWT